jgi:YD repeat-containing protein
LLATKSFDDTGALHSEVRYIYDANGRLTAEQHVDLDGRITTPTTYAYDDAGRKVKITEPDFPGEADMIARRVEYRYDDRGEAVEVSAFNIDGALVTRLEITRDAQGNSLEETQYIGDAFPFQACASGSCSTEEVAALTEEQEAEVAQVFSRGGVMSKHIHSYDTEGRLIESKLTMIGVEVNKQTYGYDEVGNRSEQVNYNTGVCAGKAIFTREYDKHGNWTQELVSNASSRNVGFGLSTPARVTRRLITYW